MQYRAASIVELKKQMHKSIYCFGAGSVFERFICEFKLENYIKAVADNNAKMFCTNVKTVNGVQIPIFSLDQMLADITDHDCILITVKAYEEIIEQLDKIEKLDAIQYYIYSILQIEQEDYERINIKIPSCLSAYKEVQIPKVIHYCWFGEKEIPKQQKKWMESWKKYCPDYEIIEWNESNYDVHKSMYMSQAYDLKKWAFVTDYVRMDIIHEYGGVYLDTDVELLKNIDVLLMNDSFCGFENSTYVNFGSGIGAKKGNQILRELKEHFDSIEFILEDGTLNQTTGPVIQTGIMKRHGLECNGEFQIVDGMTVYPSRIICGMNPHSFRLERNPVYTYAIHHFAGSWVDGTLRKEQVISRMKKWGKKDDIYEYDKV